MKKYHLIILILSTAIAILANENKQFSIGANTMSMNYMEYQENGDKFNSERTDASPGFSIGYKTRVTDGLDGEGGYIDAELSHFYGDTEYMGSWQGGSYGDIVSTTKNSITDANIGYSENKSLDQVLWFVRIGIGYRSWERALEYELFKDTEHYSWPYGSLSTGVTTYVFPNDNIGVLIEYHRALSPKMKSSLLGAFDLGHTDGYSISIPWVHSITPSWALKFAYTYQTWNSEPSNIMTSTDSSTWIAPRSESSFNLFNAALIYHY